jgi:Zn-dependent protease
MHGYASYWLGDHTAKLEGRLSLNPVKHIDPFLTILLPLALALSGGPIFGGAKPVPFNPLNIKYGEWGVALVALAGPIANFAIAFVLFAIWVFVQPVPSFIGEIFITAITVNLGFFVFNMIPIPPLDGSRLLYALAPDFFRSAMEAVERYGILIVFALVIFGGTAISSFMSDAISFFFNLFGHVFGY